MDKMDYNKIIQESDESFSLEFKQKLKIRSASMDLGHIKNLDLLKAPKLK